MSLEFNRRSFLKYTAVAAVAVAGSSLLTGCGKDSYQKTGGIGDTLTLLGDQTMYNDATNGYTTLTESSGTYTLTCPMGFSCDAKRGNGLNPSCFVVWVDKASGTPSKVYYNSGTNNTITGSDKTYTMKLSYYPGTISEDDGTVKTTLTVEGIDVAEGDTISVRYWPKYYPTEGENGGYSNLYCTWTMSVKRDSNGSLIVK